MNRPLDIVLGSSESEHLTIRPHRREREVPDPDSGNWVVSTVNVRVGGFEGHVNGTLRAEDFVILRDELQQVHKTLSGEAVLETMEMWLQIRIKGNGKGQLDVNCEVRDRSDGNRLLFKLDLDQTRLPRIIGALDEVIAAFPIVP